MAKKEKKVKGKITKLELSFTILSLIFLIGFTCFYGYRLIHYYRIYNPKTVTGEKTELMGVTIRKNTPVIYEGDGLYSIKGTFVYKGDVDNNYVSYSNLLWRIVKINNDNSILLITDEYVNNLMWDDNSNDYNSSNIRDWLVENGNNTGIFEKTLRNKEKYLQPNTICKDTVNDLESFSCNQTSNDDYVSLLNLNDYINSLSDGTSYINHSNNIWLSTPTSDNMVWHVLENNVSKSTPDNGYAIKPVITLQKTAVIQSGSGTINEPYIFEEETEQQLNTYSYVKLANDIWRVYEKNDNHARLILDNYYGSEYNTYNFSPIDNKFNTNINYSLAKYLNTTVYNSLTYKHLLVECDWYTGEYTKTNEYNYKNVFSNKISAKVGTYNVSDIKLNSSLSNYFFMTPADNGMIYSFNNDENLFTSKITYIKRIRPAICIDKTKIVKGNGTKNSPYELEV
ncbi:MAG: hypothetical protein PHO63_03365 [Bacilli bacterium]|nr:hypothetical protein [Bacilli bacterium]MDD4808969.1 hypothetical protein [Bacilli bacterium]